MGRRRTHKDATRTKIVSVRMTPETYDRVTAHAQKLGITRSGYLEHLIDEKPLVVKASRTEVLPTTLINELKRIGNNINQIAHNMNAQLAPHDGAVAKEIAEVIKVLTRDAVVRRRLEEARASAAAPSLTPAEEVALDFEKMDRAEAQGEADRKIRLAEEHARKLVESARAQVRVPSDEAKLRRAEEEAKTLVDETRAEALGAAADRIAEKPPAALRHRREMLRVHERGERQIARADRAVEQAQREHQAAIKYDREARERLAQLGLPPPQPATPPKDPLRFTSLAAKRKHDSQTAPARPKFPWSLFVRSPRR